MPWRQKNDLGVKSIFCGGAIEGCYFKEFDIINRVDNVIMAENIWKSNMCNAVEETNIESTLAATAELVVEVLLIQLLFTTSKVYLDLT